MFVRASVICVGVTVIMILISPVLTAITLASIVPILLFAVLVRNKLRYLTMQQQEEKAKMTTVAEESFSNVRTVKAFSSEDEELTKFMEGNSAVFQLGRLKAIWNGFVWFIVRVYLYGALTAIVYFTAIFYKRGEISLGNISSYLFYLIMLIINVGMIAEVFRNIYSLIGASDKIVEIIQLQPAINTKGGDKMEQVKGSIEIKDIKFSYPSKPDVEVLKGVTIEVANDKKRVIALCGTSGCGKSSIIAMIERFYDPIEGQVLFNGIDIRTLDPRWYHE
jgi:ABC-type multidrug transport system fused ATPase/permease subunit